MFRLTVHARNLALFFVLLWTLFDFMGVYDYTLYGAVLTGTTLFVMQFIVFQVGSRMMSSKKNAKASDLKRAIVMSGMNTNDNLNEKIIMDRYSAESTRFIFIALPFLLMAISATKLVFVNDPVWFAVLLLSASLFMALQPIYNALSKSKSVEV